MQFDPGLDVELNAGDLSFAYGAGTAGPKPEFRSLDAIRASLRDSTSSGPDPVYGIAMDVARSADMLELRKRMLLFGAVVYAAGKLGREPVRSQGHVHAIAGHSGWSPPEWFEIWEGSAIVYAQEHAGDLPGKCIAVRAEPGQQVVVPPGWAHCVINADPRRRMAFGALCDRQYGFIYDEVRRHGGLAWFPVISSKGAISWERNPMYAQSSLVERAARPYPELGCDPRLSIYRQFIEDPESVNWVSEPQRMREIWPDFVP